MSSHGQFTGLDVPIDTDNEALILSNAIQSPEHLEKFETRVLYTHFRVPQFQAIAWALHRLIELGLAPNLETLLLKVKSAPNRAVVQFEMLNDLSLNYALVDIEAYKEHINTLVQTSAKAAILKVTVDSIMKRCLDPRATLDDVAKSLEYATRNLEDGYSATTIQLESIGQLLPKYREQKSEVSSAFVPLGMHTWIRI
jgi:hypothetical protein